MGSIGVNSDKQEGVSMKEKKETSSPSPDSSRERENRLAGKNVPPGQAEEANQEKKVEGPNRPST